MLDALFCEVMCDVRRHDHHRARLVGFGQKQSTIAQLVPVLQDSEALRYAIVVAVPADCETSRHLARVRRRRNLAVVLPHLPAAQELWIDMKGVSAT